jgi:putative DNA primase/helicase
MPDGSTFPQVIGEVARQLLGEPNPHLSSRDTWRYGTHGSLAVEVGGEKAGTWFDHEANQGGGVVDLVRRELRLGLGEVAEWLHRHVGMAPLPEAPHPLAGRRKPSMGRIVATYDYHAANGALAFQVVRFDPKDFRQRRPDGAGGWSWSVKGLDLVPYRLPALVAAPAGSPVFMVEGEKDADALHALGLVATCNPGGAGKWRGGFRQWLRGRDVVLLPDNDEAGAAHAQDVARKLAGTVASLRVVNLPDLPPKGDVSDWLAAGGTVEALLQMAAAAEAYEAPAPEPKERPDADPNLELTEDGVALAFARKHGEALRYCHDTGGWYVWTGTHWRVNKDKIAFSWARQLVRSLNRNAEFKTKAITGKASFAGAVEKFAQADRAFAVTGEAWDAALDLIGTPGGVVNLRTGDLRPAQRGDMMTKTTAVAPAEAIDCPTWLGFLMQATAADAELIRFLQQWCGYCLSGSTREHALLFIYGPGGNGKSVFLNTLSFILGDYCRSAPMDTFTASPGDKHPTDLAMLRGARLVTATETEEGRAWAEARIKQMTGGDPVTARFMRQDFFTYTPQFKLTIAGNHKPALKNVDDAARRRFNIVPFLHKPERPDHQLEHKLKAEAPGILRWMIDGCLDWQRHGLVRPKIVTDATAEYFEAQDTIGRWLAERAILAPHLEEKPGKLVADCRAWAAENGEAPPTPPQFRSAIERLNGIRYATVQGTQKVKGIGLRVQPDARQGGEGGGGWR